LISEYDSERFDPPAPVVGVLLSAPGDRDLRIAASALVDTGADVSVLGPGIAARLRLPLARYQIVAGVNGVPERVPLWRVAIDVGSRRRFEVEAVELGGETILGRDVLNGLSVHCDGPRRRLTIRT
jgi:predicted aspartyl protease